eukprot:s2383_g4.t1
MSRILRHDDRTVLTKHMEFSLEGFQRTSVKPYDWHPRKFFSFLMANSRGRFNIWVAPVALTFGRFLDWDFHIGISATQGHTRVPEQVSEISLGERLSIERCRKLGMIFHATDNANYEGIRERGLVLEATRASWQRHRLAVHFVYAGGVTSPGLVKYGPYVFYCNLDYESYLNHGHELYLTDNGVLHMKREPRPPQLPQALLRERYRDASPDAGSSPRGEVPTLDAEALRKLIRENELREDRERRQATTHSGGSTRYAYQPGDTVHGKVDAHKSQQQEELNEVLRKARTNPWHLFAHGVLHRTDGSGQRMFSTFDDPLVKVTPWHTLSKEMRTLLGGEYNWASWMSHPLSGYSLHCFLKAFELGKLQGNYLVELNHKPRVYTGGYKDVYQEISHVRDDFSLLVTIVAESYGPDFFSYIQKNSQHEEIRRKYMVRTPEGYGLYDSTLRQPFNGAYILACADRVEEILEPEKDTPMDASEATAEAAHSPPGETADSAKALHQKTESKDEHMGATEEVNDETTDKEGSPQEEESMPDISPHTEDEGELHDQGIWGKCKTVADPEAYKATKDAEAFREPREVQ